MIALPSEHSSEAVDEDRIQFYLDDFDQRAEQSAIYDGISFRAVGEIDNGIVLTPQCDIGDAGYVLLARIVSVGEIFLYWLVEKNRYTDEEAMGHVAVAKDKKKRRALVKNFSDSYLKNETFGYYYLPAIEDLTQDSLVAFEITECLGVEELKKYKKIAVLKSPFREAVPSHFSGYIGRIGTPRFDVEVLRAAVDSQCRIIDS